ncbi:MAG: hypothetical protein LKG56_02345 [Lachnospiraceae bacterium]|jgi:hypothetical protein|nr:hypothetical protein [Lachnospiraceae bacterium]MCH4030364.1 hypothetical protein [Lachnospiraceae bacterium]MCH4069576.1 hypothetical protein [Lachnospiraceae bacterium]MCH4107488.1 hypothetical protein [Lachnospiraceae bacterium]MCI1301661.1 hypothetical protein [Lachnospiraceae bacterium]
MANKNRNLMENLSEKERKKLEKRRERKAKEDARIEKAREAEKERQEKKRSKEDAKISEEKDEQTVTSYDRKMAEREKIKRSDARAAKIMKISLGAACAIIAAALIWHYGSQYYYTDVKYIAVGDQNISKTKYEYYYGYAKRDFLNQTLYGDMTYGDYMTQYMSYDEAAGDSTQYYGQSGYTYEQAFNSLAIDTIRQEMALLEDMGTSSDFTYDTQDSDYDTYMSSLDSDAETAGMSREDYIKSVFGENATEDSISSWIKNDLKCQAYLTYLQDNTTPTDDDIQNYYSENKQSLDTVTYRYYSGSADNEGDHYDDAMEMSDMSYSGISNTDMADWLFDESRQAGDSTIIADTSSTTPVYYYVYFENRTAPDLTTDSIKTTVKNNMIYDKIKTYEDNYTFDNVKDHLSVMPDDTNS